MRKPLVILCALAFVAATAAGAWAWSSFSSVSAKAAGVTFTGVEMSSPNKGKDRCRVHVRVKAEVPDNKPRTFWITVTTAQGKTAAGRATLGSKKKKGTHWLKFSTDTAGSDCWAAKVQRPRALTVTGCEGAGCKPE